MTLFRFELSGIGNRDSCLVCKRLCKHGISCIVNIFLVVVYGDTADNFSTHDQRHTQPGFHKFSLPPVVEAFIFLSIAKDKRLLFFDDLLIKSIVGWEM